MLLSIDSKLRTSVLLFCALVSAGAFAAPPNTDDLLVDLPAGMRAAILNGADAQRICKIRVLEKELGLKFQAGSPTSEPAEVGEEKPCDSDRPTGVVSIASADELIHDEGADPSVDDQWRSKWFSTPPALCRFKSIYSAAVTRAAEKLEENEEFTLVDESDRSSGRCFAFGGEAANLWQVGLGGSMCAGIPEGVSPSAAARSLYTSPARMGCAPGALTLQMLGMYEVFAGSDGVMSPSEAERFDRYYADFITGEFRGIGSTGSIEGSRSPYEGRDLHAGKNYKVVQLGSEATRGKNSIVGYRIVVDTKKSYKDRKRPSTTSFAKWANFTENAVILSSSSEGAADMASLSTTLEGSTLTDEQVGQFESDMKDLRTAMLKLNYLSEEEGPISDESLWQPWDQFISPKNQKAIAAGTYEYYNATEDDLRNLKTVMGILNKPRYRDTKVYVHPIGQLTLAQVAVQIIKHHRDAKITLYTPYASQHRHYANFVDSRMDACLAKAAAAR